ncbi:MAG TPA: Crp/Fnr family transcriptional regulator [Burkholderiaceae bacterium]|nr:Crp/Fnr family transcriptional regulator [Burkholderiaceae bacterium]
MTTTSEEQQRIRDRLLQQFPIFADLPEPRLTQVLEQSQLRQVAAGGTMFESNLPCTGFPLVLEGSVRVAKMAPTGREIVLYRVAPGEGCILAGSCLLGNSDYSATALAEDDVTVLVIPPPLFQELLLHHEPFRRFVFDMYGARLGEVMELLEEVAFRRLDTRLAQLLIHRGPVIQATHQSIADELGSVRVFVSRLLRNFEQRGWVKLEREKVTVTDLQGLAQFAKG